MRAIKVVLAGQPNVGKSSLINAISNANLKVGNFAGVTVEKLEVNFKHHSHFFNIVDLPGTYSIEGFSKEEKIAKDYLLNQEYDVIINVVDSTHLTRNLLLTMELINLNKKMVLVLNMMDEAKKEGLEIDIKQIEKLLGIRVVAVSSKEKKGIDELFNAIHDTFEEDRKESNIIYNDIIEEKIDLIKKFLDDKGFKYKDLTNREVAIKLIFQDEIFFKFIHDSPLYTELSPLLISSMEDIYTYYETKNISDIKKREFFAISKGIAKETIICNREKKQKNLTQKIDSILLHKYFGIPIFLFFMWALFQLTFTLGAIPVDMIDNFFSFLSSEVGKILNDGEIKDLIVDGIIPGVGAVVMFLPNILVLFLGISLLETTGYMSRVAFLLDGFFHKFGLHGKSFIPLVTGFGCSVPAYMAARTLKSEKDRLITLFIIGFMSCGARLPVYVLFTGAFFEENAGNILFLIYISGAILGLFMAKMLRLFVFKGEDEPFVMEMPKYRLPSLKLLYFSVSKEALMYLKKAGTFILGVTILIYFASNYPKNSTLEDSYLGQLGKATAPFFEPLGFDWKQTVSLEMGLAAKEVIISTLGVLYNVGDDVDENNDKLLNALKSNIPFASAVSFIVFVMIYLPCLAASMVFVKEAGGYRYLGYLFVFTTTTAWIMSFIAYNIAKLF